MTQRYKKLKVFILIIKELNAKIKKILGWTPKYRNYKLGLREILKVFHENYSTNITFTSK